MRWLPVGTESGRRGTGVDAVLVSIGPTTPATSPASPRTPPKEQRSLYVDYDDLYTYDPDLAERSLDRPGGMQEVATPSSFGCRSRRRGYAAARRPSRST